MVNSEIAVDPTTVAELCRKFGVSRLRVFGSALRSDFDPGRSDVDLLVEFLPGVSKSLFKLVEMQGALSQLFGREVDLMTPASLSKYFRDDVLGAAEVLYDAT
jgi:predicted nucleotidyltransferase